MNAPSTSTPSASADGTTRTDQPPASAGALTDTKSKLTTTARDAAAKVRSAVADTAAKAKDQATHLATEKKEAASARLGGYSSALHDSARSLEEKDPNIAWFTHRAAAKLQGVADYMRHRDFHGLRADGEDLARRHPAVFFGGLFVAGLILGNIVKASRRKLEDSDDRFDGPRDAQGRWSNDARRDALQPPPELTAAEREAAGL